MIKRELPAYTVPALDHDAMMAEKYGHKLHVRQRIERRVVAALCAYMESNGWRPAGVDDGEEYTSLGGHLVDGPTKAAMELIFNLDESRLFFCQVEGTARHSVYIVLGNDGWDAISDWSYAKGDGDEFNQALDWFISDGIEAIQATL